MTEQMDSKQTDADTNNAVVAWIGFDWAYTEHEIAEYNVGTKATSLYKLEHLPESLHQWALELRKRYDGAKIGVVLEQSRGPVVYALTYL